jgi:predicted O-linked N-acetylglucosamine transferase (SPINDLY family)
VTPRVSVFLFCKDRAHTIRRSVESVLAQTFPDFEYVIQDGASTDGTLEILREYEDPRIRLRSEPDTPAEAFWRALRRCRGEFVCACLSDEQLLPHAIDDGVRALDADAAAVALTRDAELVDLDGRRLGGPDAGRGQPFDVLEYLANRFAPNFAAAMFRRQALDAVGLHTRPWHPECGEFELWCRLALAGRIAYRPGIAARYAIHNGQLSRNIDNAVRIARARIAVIDQLAGETGQFGNRPDAVRAARAATAVSFARHLTLLGAPEQALDLLHGVADGSGRLVQPRPETPAREFVSVARGELWMGRTEAALATLETAIRHTRVDARLLCDLATLYADAGRTERALALFDAAAGLAPALHEAHWQRGRLLEERGRIDDALAAWAASGASSHPQRHSDMLVAALKSPSATNASLLRAHRAWAQAHALPQDATPALPPWQPGQRITIGYCCSFWDADTIAYQLLPLLRRHDRTRFRVIAYALSRPGPRVAAAVDEVYVTGGLSDREFVQRVRADGVHILVELTGHSYGNRFAAMGARCAPVQVSYLNYTSTCGVDAVDYVVADEIAVPPDQDAYFTEAVYRVPGCFFCFTYEGAELPPVTPPPSLAEGRVTFGCFGSGGKINPPLLDLWAEILRRVPNARLFLRNRELTAEDNRRAMLAAFAARGVTPAQLLILPGTGRAGVLESYARVDISLDTHPYCGGNTVAESLWQGVPVVTLRGERFSSAYGASLLHASGLAELVAASPQEYVAKAVALAGDPVRLRAYRASLRQMVVDYGFSDPDRFTAVMENAYHDMLLRTCGGRSHAMLLGGVR